MADRQRRIGRRPPALLLVLFATTAVLAACSGGAQILSNVGSSVDGGESYAAAGASAASTGSPGGGSTVGSDADRKSNGSGAPQSAPQDDAKIVRTGSLDLQVAELDPSLAKAHDAIVGLGGYVGQSQESNDGDRSTANVTYRIPVDRWDDARAALRGLATKVVGEQTNAIEVTGQLIDLGARIDNLRASEKALQAILEKATKVQDILDVEGRLSDVRGQIEQLEAQRVHLADQAALGTLSVTFRLPVVAVAEAQQKWSPGEEIDRATASLVDLLQAGGTAGIWFAIVWIPALVFLGIVLAIGLFVARRLGVGRPRVRGGPDIAGGEPA
jgi:Domain of unknown function (DUF4349)